MNPSNSTFILVHLSELGGEKSLFLASRSFAEFARQPHFAPVFGKGSPPSSKSITIPQGVIDDMAPILSFPLQGSMELTIGSAENDAYLQLMRNVEVFDTYSDLMEYAINNGFEVDEKNGFDGMIY